MTPAVFLEILRKTTPDALRRIMLECMPVLLVSHEFLDEYFRAKNSQS